MARKTAKTTAKSKANTKTKSMGRIYHKKTVIDGITFDSQTEAEYYEYLKNQKENKLIKNFTMQDTFILQDKFLIVDGQKIDTTNKDFNKIQKKNPGCTTAAIKYIADFTVYYNDGTVRVIDVKGQKTVDFKIKEKMFNYLYPQYNKLLCIVKYCGEWLDYDTANKLKKEKKKNRDKKDKNKKNK